MLFANKLIPKDKGVDLLVTYPAIILRSVLQLIVVQIVDIAENFPLG
jgi:hypothetical protein